MMHRQAISLLSLALALACAEPGDPGSNVPPAPGPEIDPPQIIPDPDPENHTRLYPAACREETISSEHRHIVQRTFDGDDIASEATFRDDLPITTTSFEPSAASKEQITIQHQVAMRYRTIEISDAQGRLVQRQKLRGSSDADPDLDLCRSIETHKYPETGKHVVEIDDDCDGVDGTVTTTRTGDREIVVRDEDGDGVSEVITFNFFDDLGQQIRRVDLHSGTSSTEWNWDRSEDEGTEVVEYYLGTIGDQLLTRTETLRSIDGSIRSQSEFRALGDLTISRSFDDFGNPLTEVTRDGEGNQISIRTFDYECWRASGN